MYRVSLRTGLSLAWGHILQFLRNVFLHDPHLRYCFQEGDLYGANQAYFNLAFTLATKVFTRLDLDGDTLYEDGPGDERSECNSLANVSIFLIPDSLKGSTSVGR